MPIWVAGLVALLRRPAWRATARSAWTWPVVFAIVVLAGGKGYYDAPLLLVLTAAGAAVTVDWARRGAARARRALLAVAAVLTVAGSTILLLPVLPADRLPGFVVDGQLRRRRDDRLAGVHRLARRRPPRPAAPEQRNAR